MRVLLALALALSAARAQQVDQRAVLLEFYEATGGDAWTSNDGWAQQTSDECEWTGVVCEGDEDPLLTDDEGRRRLQSSRAVIGLSLQSNSLRGRTPDSLWTLPLTHLDVSYNSALELDFTNLASATQLKVLKLHATATASLTGISSAADSLTSFHVSGAPLQSALPAELWALTNLEYLHLSDCALVGNIPSDVAKLTNLRILNVAENRLEGSLPSALASLEHLRVLAVSRNALTGNFPTLNNLLLHEVYADSNGFTGLLPSFSKQPGIERLHMQDNHFAGSIPEDFLAQRGISGDTDPLVVDLSKNELNGEIPVSLEVLEDLNLTLNLADNQFTSISSWLCDNLAWNSGISPYGCDAIACPIGTYAEGTGRAHGPSQTPCQDCPNAPYMGASSCLQKDDLSILQEIYRSTAGVEWKRATGWNTAPNFCTWYGVQCWTSGTENGHVRKLRLPNNGLKGQLPASVFNLKYMSELDLSRNAVSVPFDRIGESSYIHVVNVAATLTKDFDGMEQAGDFLHYLHADRTPIDGTLPYEILQATSLKVLSLSEAQLKGELSADIGNMVGLEELYLFGNNLRGTLPSELTALPGLRYLSLAQNQLTGSLPDGLDDLSDLRALSLSDQVSKGGGLTGPVPELRNLRNLTALNLDNNKLEGTVPSTLLADVDLDTPVTIDLSNNALNGTVPGSLARFERLSIFLTGNVISSIDQRLCAMDHWMDGLVSKFDCNAILCPANTEGGLQKFADQPCKACADSSAGLLGQEQCKVVRDMTEHEILEELYFQCGGLNWHTRSNWLSDDVCQWYGVTCDETGAVTALSLGSNQLVGDFPTSVYNLPKLEKLMLHSNSIRVSFDGIENANKLAVLVLDSTGLDSLSGIGLARNLEELNVKNNRLTGHMDAELSRLVKLKSLNIANNQISGSLPFWLSSLPNLATFVAANNKLGGKLYDFANTKNLMFLDLSMNQLTGPVPSNLLEYSNNSNRKLVVDLTHNRLSGLLPRQLDRFNYLTLLVANNQIAGIDAELCDVRGWNDNQVGAFGCDGILCPVGTANALGRQTSADNPCVPCGKAKYMGSTACHGSFSGVGAYPVWVGLLVTMIGILRAVT